MKKVVDMRSVVLCCELTHSQGDIQQLRRKDIAVLTKRDARHLGHDLTRLKCHRLVRKGEWVGINHVSKMLSQERLHQLLDLILVACDSRGPSPDEPQKVLSHGVRTPTYICHGPRELCRWILVGVEGG